MWHIVEVMHFEFVSGHGHIRTEESGKNRLKEKTGKKEIVYFTLRESVLGHRIYLDIFFVEMGKY